MFWSKSDLDQSLVELWSKYRLLAFSFSFGSAKIKVKRLSQKVKSPTVCLLATWLQH